MTETELPRKQQRIGRTRRALCAIRGFVDRYLTTRTVIVFTILLLLASWIYPPWIIGTGRNVSHRWFFVFDTTREVAMRVDFGRLFLIDAVILAAGGLLAWAVFHDSTIRRATVRIAFYTLVIAPIAGLICFGVVSIQNAIQNVQHEVAKTAATPKKRFDPSTAALVEKPKGSKASLYDVLLAVLPNKQPVTVEIPGQGIAEFPAGMSDDQMAAVIKKQFFSDKYLAEKGLVAQDDLKKVILFDVNAVLRPPAGESGFSYWDFMGRVRNDLSRAVEKVGVKASFYTGAGELIEVRTFWMLGPDWQYLRPLVPSSSVIFHSNVDFVYNLPVGWTYRLEVIEAQYVPDIFDSIDTTNK